MAVVVSLAIGVFFGLYPANRAGEVEPDPKRCGTSKLGIRNQGTGIKDLAQQ